MAAPRLAQWCQEPAASHRATAGGMGLDMGHGMAPHIVGDSTVMYGQS